MDDELLNKKFSNKSTCGSLAQMLSKPINILKGDDRQET